MDVPARPTRDLRSPALPVILDGGLATELERRGADLGDRLWSARLLLDDPTSIRTVHRAYAEAGAEVATTATYQASTEGFGERGIDADGAGELMRLAVRLAREAMDEAGGGLVAASVGPFGASRADGSEYTGDYGGVSVPELAAFHRERAHVLAGAEPDLLAVETIPSLPELEALASVLGEIPDVPVWISFSARDGGHIADGTPVDRAARVAASIPSVVAVGVNCTPAAFVPPLLRRIESATGLPGVVYPNAGGDWDAQARAWTGDRSSPPDALARAAQVWLDEGARWIGGCCGFGTDAIDALARRLSPT